MESSTKRKAEFFRVLQCEDNFTLEFAQKGDGEDINIIASIEINAQEMLDVVLKLLSAGMKYQEESGKNIGFPQKDN